MDIKETSPQVLWEEKLFSYTIFHVDTMPNILDREFAKLQSISQWLHKINFNYCHGKKRAGGWIPACGANADKHNRPLISVPDVLF